VAGSSVGATASTAASVKKLLEVSPSKLSILVGATQSLVVTTEGLQDATLLYTSSDENIATVTDKGVVKGITAGNVKITVTSQEDKSLTGSAEVTVTAGKTLKTQNGDVVYIRDGKGYKEATEADYYTETKFYTRAVKKKYKYFGWQTLDGHTYYFDKDGEPVTGEQVIQGGKYRFDDEGILANGSGVLGIDVSRWNGSIDWNAVKNSGVNYAIIRCGFRGTATGALVEDSAFHTNMRGAQKAGLKVGVYFFSAAVNDVEAVEEASMAASLCSGYSLSYPIFLDVERSDSGNGRADGISTSDRTAVIKAFCATIRDSGYKAGLYANKTWMEEMIETPSLTGYKLWLAQYAAEPSYARTRYDMWQYTSKGSIAGISGKVDLNLSYLNY
ncbi:MAG: Ig-like domain-containing protein, partial [Lachnospiraceae bacterium]|nr:Ig-like domain-containing protein [Lachnospiraceae bacterium]